MTKVAIYDLSGDELALAESAVQLAISWHKKQPPSDYGRKEIEKLDALNAKLSAINSFAYPYEDASQMADGIGSETIMRLDSVAIAMTRAAASRVSMAERFGLGRDGAVMAMTPIRGAANTAPTRKIA